ncbi:hypothetical protein AB0G74_22160 [Streptomyces sp. NPDC020875]|uniref:hypothetical protein n=1 Tax=Streptomyces sp. NPDC020875 TaxID=3154898 RepID=UPI0033D796CB
MDARSTFPSENLIPQPSRTPSPAALARLRRLAARLPRRQQRAPKARIRPERDTVPELPTFWGPIPTRHRQDF